MANIKKLKENGQDIVPITHEQAVLDSNGVTLDSKLNTINNAISRLENNTPSLVGNTLTFGNYTIKYNSVDDTLDFLYNSTIDEPTEETVALTWAVGNLDSSGAEIVQDSTLKSDFVTIEDNYIYSFYLESALSDPTGIRVYFYNSDRGFISRTSSDALGYTTGTDIPIDIPSNAAYMRFKSNINDTTTLNNINSLFTLRKRKIEVNSYVREGLSMYINASDVATYGSVRNIVGNYTVTNHGVSLTSDNKYLNFVSTESDYIDTNLVPNLTTWSAEVYFYFTETPGAVTQIILGWGGSGNKIRIGYSDSYGTLVAQSNNEENRTIANASDLLSPHHLIVTMNNGALTSYLDGVKTVLCASGGIQTPHTGTLKIGSKYDGASQFANIHLKSLRFYDGKVLSDEEALQNYRYETKNTYVTNGLSLYIDANDVTTQGSVRDITGKQNIVNHGVSTTLDNGCLNFVASESDYIDCGFKPNLTKWSLEYNFYLAELPSTNITMIGWGASGNRTAIGIWGDGSTYMIAINDGTENRICAKSLLLSLVHVILTYDNGSIIAYVNGEKSQIATNANVMTSQASNLMIGAKYSADEFADIHLKSFRFYDGKVLTDEEALQNYNYEINRG